MAIDFIEGFDWLTSSADILLHGWSSGGCVIATANPRYSGGTYAQDVTLIRTPTTPSETVVIGAAINPVNGTFNIFKLWETATPHITILIQAATGYIVVQRGSTTIATSTLSVTFASWSYIEAKVVIHDSTGSVIVHVNGTEFINFSGDTRNAATGVINKVNFGEGSGVSLYDDIYIKTGTGETMLGDVRVDTIFPSGAGTTTEWTPSAGANYENVDDDDPDADTTYNSEDTPGSIDLYAFENMSAASGTIYAVQQTAICRKDDAGARTIKHITRPVSTNYLSDAKSIGDTYAGYLEIREVNPEDSAAWEIADVNGAEWGIELEA